MLKEYDSFEGTIVRGTRSFYDIDVPELLQFNPEYWVRGDKSARAAVKSQGWFMRSGNEPSTLWFLGPLNKHEQWTTVETLEMRIVDWTVTPG